MDSEQSRCHVPVNSGECRIRGRGWRDGKFKFATRRPSLASLDLICHPPVSVVRSGRHRVFGDAPRRRVVSRRVPACECRGNDYTESSFWATLCLWRAGPHTSILHHSPRGHSLGKLICMYIYINRIREQVSMWIPSRGIFHYARRNHRGGRHIVLVRINLCLHTFTSSPGIAKLCNLEL